MSLTAAVGLQTSPSVAPTVTLVDSQPITLRGYLTGRIAKSDRDSISVKPRADI